MGDGLFGLDSLRADFRADERPELGIPLEASAHEACQDAVVDGDVDKTLEEGGAERLSIPPPQDNVAVKWDVGMRLETPVKCRIGLCGGVQHERFGRFQAGVFGVLVLHGTRPAHRSQ